MPRPTTKERIEARHIPEPNSGCWIWLGPTYGFGNRERGKLTVCAKTVSAHRLSFEAFIGPITGSLQVLHKCDTGLCVNPGHLWLGTHIDNMRDMRRKGRHRFGSNGFGQPHSRNKGAENPRAKLTAEQAAYAFTSTEPASDLARRFGVAPYAIRSIRNGRTWRSATVNL